MRNRNLTAEIARSKDGTNPGSDKVELDNIKGTLLQFLKGCPVTDKNNEAILAIVFSMMELSKEEI